MPRDLVADVNGIKFTSIPAVGAQVRDLELATEELGPAIGIALGRSPLSGLRTVRGILDSAPDPSQGAVEAAAIVDWAASTGSDERRLLAEAARLDNRSLVLVHHLTGLPRATARPFVADYLAAGGGMRAIAEWLRLAGGVLRERGKAPGTDGFVGDAVDAVGHALGEAVDAVAEGIGTLVDAVVSAGKGLVDVVNEVINWSVQQVADLVHALIEAGKSVAEILGAALGAGADALKKFVRAAVAAGRAIGEALAWAAGAAAGVMTDVVAALRDAAVSVGRILEWAAGQALDAAGRALDALAAVGQGLGQVLAAAADAAAGVLGATLSALLRLGRTVGQLLQTLVTQPGRILSAAVRALIELGHSVAELLEDAAAAIADGVRTMARVLLDVGRSVLELVEWAVAKTADVLRDVVGAILQAGRSVVDLLASVASRAFSMLRSVVAALFELGRTLAGLLGELVNAALDVLSAVIKAAIDLGRTVAELVGHVLSRTYRLAARFIQAALDAGIAAATLLAEVAGGTYWTLRKMVNGILKALGPVGEVLDWALSQAESAVSEVWHRTLAAIRYAGGTLTDALDWAAARSGEALEAIVRAWEDVGEALEEVLRWAKDAGEAVWEAVGTVWTKIENSVSYVLLFLERDFIPGIARFVKGALDAGAAIADFVVFIATRPLVVGVEVAKALLAFGATIGQLLVEVVTHPDRAMDNLMAALDAAGATLRDVYRAAIVETGQAFLKEVSLALQRIGRSITAMLHAVAEVAAGAVATVISHLLNTLASYRPLTAQEKAEARDVFQDSVDLDRVFVSSESLLNDIIFGLQDWANGTPDSRAFTTDTLINFDVDDGIERHTLVHELTHVWQALVTGPFYMAEAIHAQTTAAGYNYGYSKPDEDNRTVELDVDFAGARKELFIGEATGEGAQAELAAANGDFDAFNREQQAQIIMHWFVRKRLLKRPEADYAPWQPYVDVVRAAA